MGFLGSFLGGFGGRFLLQPVQEEKSEMHEVRALEGTVDRPCSRINWAMKSVNMFLQTGVAQQR